MFSQSVVIVRFLFLSFKRSFPLKYPGDLRVRDGEKQKHHRQVNSIVFTLLENTRSLDTSRHTKSIQNCSFLYDRLYRIIKIIILFVYSNGRKTKPNQKSKMKWIVTGIRYIQEYCLFFSFDCCCKGVITFSCLPGSSQRMLPLLQYFNFHGLRQSSRRRIRLLL